MMKSLIVLASLLGTLALSGCNMPDPCVTLGPPSPVEIQAAQGGAEVEREIQNTECVVVNDRWVNATNVED